MSGSPVVGSFIGYATANALPVFIPVYPIPEALRFARL
jgi:hypothetical protein